MSHREDMVRWIETHGHWDNHKYFPVENWRSDVEESNTRQGYKEWLLEHAKEMDDELIPPVTRPPHPLDLAYWSIATQSTFDIKYFMEDVKNYVQQNNPFETKGKTLMQVFTDESANRRAHNGEKEDA